MLSRSSTLYCQVRRFSLFPTSVCVRVCSSQFCKTLGIINTRNIFFETHAARFDKLSGNGLSRPRFPYFRGLSTGRWHRNERYTYFGRTENTSTDESANISNFSSDFAVEDDMASLTKLRSAVVEYTLDENGFMNIQDLVDFLKRESAMDICVIEASGDRRAYVDYFVIVSGVSTRHLRAMAKNLEQLFRGHVVRGIGRDGHVVIEGSESDHWVALDIGNIVVHFFLPDVREVYELEKLWTLGPKYDDQSKSILDRESFLQAAELGTKMDDHGGVDSK